MNQIVQCDWLSDWVAGAILPAQDYLLCLTIFFHEFIDHLCLTLSWFKNMPERKNELGQYLAILTSFLVKIKHISFLYHYLYK